MLSRAGSLCFAPVSFLGPRGAACPKNLLPVPLAFLALPVAIAELAGLLDHGAHGGVASLADGKQVLV
jgi:hypothetical protein